MQALAAKIGRTLFFQSEIKILVYAFVFFDSTFLCLVMVIHLYSAISM